MAPLAPSLRRGSCPCAAPLSLLAMVALLGACGTRSGLAQVDPGASVLDGAAGQGATSGSSGQSGAAGQGATAGQGGAGGSGATGGVGGNSAGSAGAGAAGGSGGAGGSGATGGSGPAGSGGSGGSGQGGSASLCGSLAWAGPPVFVSTDAAATRPRLVRTGVSTHTLVFESPALEVTLLQAAGLTAWETAWPPPVGEIVTTLAESGPSGSIAVGPGEPGTFAFATAPDVGLLTLSLVAPDGSGQSGFKWLSAGERVASVARSGGGDYLVAHGDQTSVRLDLAQDINGNIEPKQLGVLGCASPSVAVSAVGLGDNGFLVASTNQGPFDACQEDGPPGSPAGIQVAYVPDNGPPVSGAWIPLEQPVYELQLSGRIGGAWLTYRAEGDTTLRIRALDAQGQLDPTKDFALAANFFQRDAVAALGAGVALATVNPPSSSSSVKPSVSAGFLDGGALQSLSYDQPGAPLGRPAVATSNDGRSLLMAFEFDAGTNAATTIGLLRLDCLP